VLLPPASSLILTEWEYKNYLERLAFKVGDVMTLCATAATQPQQLSMLIHIQTDFNKVIFRMPSQPNAMLMVQIEAAEMMADKPWVRWDSPNGWRKITIKEYEQFIKDKDNYARLQDRCIAAARQAGHLDRPSHTSL
jgi:hypothetical protein